MGYTQSETLNDKQSVEKREKTKWHRVVVFVKLAEIEGEYLKKGSQVYIEGQLQIQKLQDQQGQDRYSTEVVVNPISGTLLILYSITTRTSHQASNQTKGMPQNEPPMNFEEDDIPF